MSYGKLTRLNLKFNPFKDYTKSDEDFRKIFFKREKELNELQGAIEFFRSGSRINISVIGESGSGKTTLINFFLLEYKEEKEIYLFEHFNVKSFSEVLENVLEELGTVRKVLEGLNVEEESKDLVRDYLYEASIYSKDIKVMHVIDDFNSILIKELDFILDVVSKSPDLFLIVVEEDTWSDALKKNVELSKHFYPIYLSPLSLEDLKMLVLLRLHVARMDDEIPLPFTDDAIQILVTYAFRNPGILINLCKKSLLNAISEGITRLDKGFVKRTIHEKTGFKNFATYLSQRQIEILEAIISEGGETDFNTLEERVGISRVAINEHLKDLFEMEIVEEADSPTKKKIFRVTKKFKAMIA